jgi:7,8-dihydropterin-6-yl-methyl-4-(beta-D-ribofuranosyl)aminobenzene 5'-phosphate synthase
VPKNVYPAYKDNFVLLEGSTKLDDGIYIVAHNNTDNNINGNNDISKNIENVDKSNDYAKIGERGKLYKKLDDRYVPDDFGHELSLVFDTEKGLVIFNSCSHVGVINIINEIKEYFGNEKKIRAFVGGLHMKGKNGNEEICTFSENEIQEMVKCLEDNHVEKLYTGHCTGVVGYVLIKKYMGDSVEYISTGKEVDLK